MKDVRKLKLEELNRIDLSEFKNIDKIPIVIVLDSIRSGLNVGSIFRTSDAYLIQKMCLCGITSTPPHKEILKTAIGANNSVDWEYYENSELAIEELKKQNYVIIGIEQTNNSIEIESFKVDTSSKYAIVLGNEVEGIHENLLPLIDTFIEIKQYGTKHSLNVSVCAGIIIHAFAKHFHAK